MGQSSLFHATYLIIYTHMYSDDVLYRWKYLHKIQPIYICVYIYMYVYMYIYIYIYSLVAVNFGDGRIGVDCFLSFDCEKVL